MSILKYKNLKVHYTEKGVGNVTVFLHGFLEDLSMWDSIIEGQISSSHVICIDLLGHGKTGNLGYIHTMEEQANMVKYVLDELGIERCAFIGHSMGGYVALAFAEMYAQHVTGICLMNSSALADTAETKINRDRGIRAVKQLHKTFVRMAIPNLFSEENRIVFKTEIQIITEKALEMSQQGIIAALEGMKVRKDTTKLLKSSLFPILMVIGKKDPALDYKSLLKQSKLGEVIEVIFEDGHMSHIENQQELIEVFTDFIKMIEHYIDEKLKM